MQESEKYYAHNMSASSEYPQKLYPHFQKIRISNSLQSKFFMNTKVGKTLSQLKFYRHCQFV